MRKEGVVHMPSSLGCRVSHSTVVTVETIAFIKNKQWILVAHPLYRKEYFHSPTCGTSTILVHPPRSAGLTFPSVSWSDEGTIMSSLNSTSSTKLTIPAILLPHAKTGRHCTTSYHWNPLGQTSPPRSSILERREYVSALLWFCVARSLYFCYDFPTLWTKWGLHVCRLLSDRSLSLQF